jgi:hypothetical protein
MPLFFDATISNLHNVIVSRLQSNDGGFEPIPLSGAYCQSAALWDLVNANQRKFWSQAESNGSELPLVFEIQPHYGRMITTALVRVAGTGYTVMPAWMPRIQVWSMNASTSTYGTAWTNEEETIDPSTTVGEYNTLHYIAAAPNLVASYNMRYAVAVFADMSSTHNMFIEGIQIGYAFTA